MGSDKDTAKRIAEERIGILLDLSEHFFRNGGKEGIDEALAKKYIALAMQIRRHYKIKSKDKRLGMMCKKCHTMLIPGITCTIRVLGKEGNIIYKCDKCGTEKRLIFTGTARKTTINK